MKNKILIWILLGLLLAGSVSASGFINYNYRVYGQGYDLNINGYRYGYYGGFSVPGYYPSNYYVARLSPRYGYTNDYPMYYQGDYPYMSYYPSYTGYNYIPASYYGGSYMMPMMYGY